MFDSFEQRFKVIIDFFSHNTSGKLAVQKAYSLAKILHKDQKRKDGKPYISHPVEVAIILAKLGFDEDVVCAALLHDVVEDCGYTIQQIAAGFNENVAKMVDCVSAVDEAKFVFDEDDIFEIKSFEKASIEEQSFKKLIAIGKENPLGIYIKFADRLHNLMTIESFEYNKQLEKVKETEKWILPLAKILGARYFYEQIKNECFKIVYRNTCEKFFNDYYLFHKLNSKYIDTIQSDLKNNLISSNICDVKLGPVLEYEVFDNLKEVFGKVNLAKIGQSQIIRVPTYKIEIIYKDLSKKEILDLIMTVYNSKFNNFKLIDFQKDMFTNEYYFTVADNLKNKFKIYMTDKKEVEKSDLGIQNYSSDDIDDDNIDSLNVELIKVKTRSGEVKYIQAESTVLDFAFKIHKEIGFGFKYAIVNGSKTKCPPYTKLYDGDMVEIAVSRDESGRIINNASLNWLAYVNTDLAKKILIKFFQKKLDQR